MLAVLALRGAARFLIRRLLGGEVADPRRFWARQGVQVVTAIVLALGVLSIWITPDTDVTTGVGLITAGLAFALQRVILSLAAYFVILRGDTFGVGDRITLGGVRGDVVRLGFLKTTIMEMGQPPSISSTDPAVWVNSRQYTGRLVTVTNGAIFNEPVYNYTRDFPYLWEEIVLPIDYDVDRDHVDQILLAAAGAHAIIADPAARHALAHMRSRYALSDASLEPAVLADHRQLARTLPALPGQRPRRSRSQRRDHPRDPRRARRRRHRPRLHHLQHRWSSPAPTRPATARDRP